MLLDTDFVAHLVFNQTTIHANLSGALLVGFNPPGSSLPAAQLPPEEGVIDATEALMELNSLSSANMEPTGAPFELMAKVTLTGLSVRFTDGLALNLSEEVRAPAVA